MNEEKIHSLTNDEIKQLALIVATRAASHEDIPRLSRLVFEAYSVSLERITKLNCEENPFTDSHDKLDKLPFMGLIDSIPKK